VEKQETEINRGLSSLCILSILVQAGDEGLHGYKILKELTEQTNDMLIIEEGTIYPILRKLEEKGIIKSRKEETGRSRKFYSMTEYGIKIYYHLAGFYSKLTEAIGSLFDVKVNLRAEKYLFCPMCANKIPLEDKAVKFCDVCGYNMEKELQERGIKK
jgi:DNA-binding PadR family transcriptional regulator